MALTQSNLIKLASGQQVTGASSAINCHGYTTAIFEVSGISGDTILVQARLDPAGTFYTHGITNVSGSTLSASILADGLYKVNVAGMADVQSNVSSYSAGDLNIHVRLTDE